MLLKGLLIVCVQAVFIKVVQSQCIKSPTLVAESLFPSNMAAGGLAPSTPVGRIVGGNLIVDTSAAEPSSVSIFSDNLIIEGTVLVTGNLPFLGTVALEGIVPGVGSSAVSYECGSGNIGISSDVPITNIPPSGLGAGLAGPVNRFR